MGKERLKNVCLALRMQLYTQLAATSECLRVRTGIYFHREQTYYVPFVYPELTTFYGRLIDFLYQYVKNIGPSMNYLTFL